MHKLSLHTLTLLLLAGLASPVFAYTSSDQTTTRLTPLTGLYTVTYSFGHGSRDLYLPIGTERDLAYGDSSDRLGYSVTDGAGGTTDAASTAALVFSDATIENGQYLVPAGTRSTFTFVAFVRTPAEAAATDYGIKVNHLPFTMVVDGNSTDQQLNQVELREYQTAAIELNPAN